MLHVPSGPKDPRLIFPSFVPRRFPTAMLDRVHDMMRPSMDMQMRCVLTLHGRVDEERLARAIRLLCFAEPLLSCRWVKSIRRPYWERRDDIDELPLCTLEKTNPAEIDSATQRHLIPAGDPSIDPIIRVHILRAEVDTLCIKMDHTASDAHGLAYCAYMLADLYDKLAEDARYLPRPNLEGSRSYGQLVAQMSNLDRLRMLRRWYRDQQTLEQREEVWALPTKPGFHERPSDGATFVKKEISPDRIKAARVFAKRFGMSLNDVLLTAHLIALREIIDPPTDWPLRLEMMVDLRRHLKASTAARLCNLSGRCVLSIEGGAKMGFTDLALRVRDRMNLLRNDLIGTGCYVFLPLLTNALPHALGSSLIQQEHAGDDIAKGLVTPLLAMGGFDPARLAFGKARPAALFGVGALVKPPFFTTALTSFGEARTLTAGFYESGFERGMVVDLFERMANALPS